MKAILKGSLVLLTVIGAATGGHAQGTALTYQGRLTDNSFPANGTYDLQFTAYDSSAGPTVVAGPMNRPNVAVAGGVFTVTLDFGTGVFTGPARWLQIAVRTNGTASFVSLNPRQALTPSPYAIHAGMASNVVAGAVVQSVNNLRDNVTLAAGANVTLTPIGNSITIAATNSGGGSGPWALNGASAFYIGGPVGVGTSTPVSRLTVSGAGAFNHPLAAAITLDNTAAARRWEWHALDDGRLQLADFTAAVTRMVFDLNGRVGIGTLFPQSKLHLFEVGDSATHLLETGGGINAWARVSFKNLNGQWDIGTSRGFNGDQFYVSRLGAPGIALGIQPNGDAFLARNVTVGGDVGIGTATPAQKLDVVGNVVASGNVGIGTTTPAHKLHIAGEGASGYAIGIEGNATQNRDKGGWVKAMAKVNADGTIARQFSAFGGTITATASFHELVGTTYLIDFPFQVNDRFISITPFYNNSVGMVAANFEFVGGALNRVILMIKAVEDTELRVANEFSIFVF